MYKRWLHVFDAPTVCDLGSLCVGRYVSPSQRKEEAHRPALIDRLRQLALKACVLFKRQSTEIEGEMHRSTGRHRPSGSLAGCQSDLAEAEVPCRAVELVLASCWMVLSSVRWFTKWSCKHRRARRTVKKAAAGSFHRSTSRICRFMSTSSANLCIVIVQPSWLEKARERTWP